MAKRKRKIKMRGWVAIGALAVLSLALLVNYAFPKRGPGGFTKIDEGLELGEFRGPESPPDGDGVIRVVRADLSLYKPFLMMASEDGGKDGAKTLRDWSIEYGLKAAINASMYQEDGVTAVSLMRKRGHFNNPHLTAHRSVLLFDPLDSSSPEAIFVDLELEGSDAVMPSYWGAVQSIRMLSTEGEVTWAEDEKRWPASLIGMDKAGRILFIHTKSSYPMHDLVKRLLELPLNLVSLQYAEGGSEAQLFVEAGELRALYSPGGVSWKVPNALGLKRR
ncbi:MAG: hypothetical protein C0608_01395 [Deltaproteobacteria bacterium]|nr:MAG: hypothetical protein C0608_01395 [Deltaproteobacteria bacterium]